MALRQAFGRAFGSTDFWLWMFVYAGVWCQGGDIPCCRSTATVSRAITILPLFNLGFLVFEVVFTNFRLPNK